MSTTTDSHQRMVFITKLDQIVLMPIDEPAVQAVLDYLEDVDMLGMTADNYQPLALQLGWDDINPVTTTAFIIDMMAQCSPHLLKKLSSVAYLHIYAHWRDGKLSNHVIMRLMERFLVDWQEVTAAEFLSGSGEEHQHMNEAKKIEVAEKLLKDSDMEHLAIIAVDGEQRFVFRGDLEDYYRRPW